MHAVCQTKNYTNKQKENKEATVNKQLTNSTGLGTGYTLQCHVRLGRKVHAHFWGLSDNPHWWHQFASELMSDCSCAESLNCDIDLENFVSSANIYIHFFDEFSTMDGISFT